MPDQFFIEEYRKKADLPNPIAQSGRGRQFEPTTFLYVAREVIQQLDLRPEHDLLDVGCANGMLDIVLSACCRHLLAVEPVAKLVALAKQNLAGCSNVDVKQGHGAAIPAVDNSFDRILLLEVIQLIPPEEVPAVFRELQRVSRHGARIFIGSIPNLRYRDAFLEPYLAGVRQATHLDDAKKAEIIARNQRAHWYDPDELTKWWQSLGGGITCLDAAPERPDSDFRFHLIVSVEKS